MSILRKIFEGVSYQCKDYHEDCLKLSFDKIFITLKRNFKLYLAFYFISTLVFKFKKIFLTKETSQDRKEMIIKEFNSLIQKILKSTVFLTIGAILLRSSSCIISRVSGRFSIFTLFLQSIITSLSLCFESKERAKTIVLYSIPHSFYSLFEILIKKKIISEGLLYNSIFILCGLIGLNMKNNNELDWTLSTWFNLFFD